MRTIEQIILHVSANVLEIMVDGDGCDNWEESPYYKGLTKEEKKYLSDYIVETYPKDWDYWEDVNYFEIMEIVLEFIMFIIYLVYTYN